MHATNIVPGENLGAFWRAVLLQAESYPEFRAPVLMLSAHGLKLTSTCEDPQVTRSRFLQHLEDCFHMDPALMPPHTTWLDFGNKDVPDGTCSEGVTLLHKTSCLEEWSKLFACPQS